MLEINNLNFNIDDKEILKNFSLKINKGETHVLMGPNGIGKSTLTKVILRHPKYQDIKGDIKFLGKSLKDLSTDEISRMGIFTAFQNPLEIDGVSNSDFLKTALDARGEKTDLFTFVKLLEKNRKEMEIPKDYISRSVNENQSGGEKKKSEILQMKVLRPKLIILDEIDSGLDVDALKLVAKNINKYLEEEKDASLLIITHYPRILDYLKVDYVHLFNNGKIEKTGDISLAFEIEKKGYKNEGL